MRKLVVGNWKSHKSLAEAQDFVVALNARLQEGDEAWIAPPAPYLASLAAGPHNATAIRWVAQQVSAYGRGAHTGEFTADMLVSCGVHAALVGHSERRECFGESDDVVREKAMRSLEAGLIPIVCVGETREEREAGRAFERVEHQVRHALTALPEGEIWVAYEPVWAIGTGLTATPDQVGAMHAHLHEVLRAVRSDVPPILYGGSVNPANVAELFNVPHVDGGLVGGASLEVESFVQLLQAGR
jgi:triosephosphate isomerase